MPDIKVTGKCALMVDMSTKYEEFPDENSEFSHMVFPQELVISSMNRIADVYQRDSLYILMIMNQCPFDLMYEDFGFRNHLIAF